MRLKLAIILTLLSTSLLAQPNPGTTTPVHLYLDVTAMPGAAAGDIFYSSNTSGFIKYLRIGSTGQCLKVASGLPSWGSCGGGGGVTSPLTTKGDLWGFDTVDNRVPVGADGYLLEADSGSALGLRWIASAPQGDSVLISDSNSMSGTRYPLWTDTTPGYKSPYTSSTKLKWQPSAGIFTAPTFNGALTGNADTATQPVITDDLSSAPSGTVYATYVDSNGSGPQSLHIASPNGPKFNSFTNTFLGTANFAGALSANGSNCTSGQFAAGVDAQGNAEGCAAPSGSAHNLLSSTHTDTNTATVVRGDLVVGDSTPAWSRLATGTNGQCLITNGTDVFWGDCATGTGSGSSSGSVWSIAQVLASRAKATVYQNTSGHHMLVRMFFGANGTATSTALSDGSNPPTTVVASVSSANTFATTLEFWVKNNDYYEVTGTNLNSVFNWIELTLTKGSVTDSGDVVGSRAITTTYQNTSGSLMFLAIQYGTGGTATILSDSSNPPTTQVWNQKITSGTAMTALVPILSGDYYKTTVATATLVHWHEYTWDTVGAQRVKLTGLRALTNTTTTSYYNSTGKSIFGICSAHKTNTGSLIVKYDPQIIGATTAVTPVSNAWEQSSTTTDAISVAYSINPAEFYTIYIDSGTTTVDNWFEWEIY